MKGHNRNLDILRGLAAVLVMLHHLTSFGFDSRYSLGKSLHYTFPAHLCVIVFFILSGYVIGLNHPTLDNKKEINSYIRKRLVRIVPIYFVVVLAVSLVLWGKYSLYDILCNLFFISVPLDNVINESTPLWSLNYEIIYYFVFILFAYFRISLQATVKVCLAAIALLFIFFHNTKVPPLLISYFIGFIFWITGALIASIKNWETWRISHTRILSLFLLVGCIQPINPYGPVLKILKVTTADYSAYSWFQQSISYNDLYFYPLTVLLIFSLTHIRSRVVMPMVYFLFVSAAFRIAMLLYTYGFRYALDNNYLVVMVLFAISVALWIFNGSINPKVKQAIKGLAPLSNVSYAVYMVHLPVICVFQLYQAPNVGLFLVKLMVYLATVFFISYLLEMKFQPFVKNIFLPRRLPSSPANSAP